MSSIRPTVPADFPAIRQLAHDIWPVAYATILSPDQLAYMLDRFYSLAALEAQQAAGHRFLILEENGTAQGFASYGPLEEPGFWKLHKLYVLSGEQGRGLGRRLLEHVMQAALQRGAARLLLNVNRFNPAVQFYERLGFRTVREEDIAIGGGYFMNDYVLDKDLTGNDF